MADNKDNNNDDNADNNSGSSRTLSSTTKTFIDPTKKEKKNDEGGSNASKKLATKTMDQNHNNASTTHKLSENSSKIKEDLDQKIAKLLNDARHAMQEYRNASSPAAKRAALEKIKSILLQAMAEGINISELSETIQKVENSEQRTVPTAIETLFNQAEQLEKRLPELHADIEESRELTKEFNHFISQSTGDIPNSTLMNNILDKIEQENKTNIPAHISETEKHFLKAMPSIDTTKLIKVKTKLDSHAKFLEKGIETINESEIKTLKPLKNEDEITLVKETHDLQRKAYTQTLDKVNEERETLSRASKLQVRKQALEQKIAQQQSEIPSSQEKESIKTTTLEDKKSSISETQNLKEDKVAQEKQDTVPKMQEKEPTDITPKPDTTAKNSDTTPESPNPTINPSTAETLKTAPTPEDKTADNIIKHVISHKIENSEKIKSISKKTKDAESTIEENKAADAKAAELIGQIAKDTGITLTEKQSVIDENISFKTVSMNKKSLGKKKTQPLSR